MRRVAVQIRPYKYKLWPKKGRPNMKAFEIALLVLAPLSLAVGCSFKIAVNEKEKSETDMGSHHVVVKPGSTSTSSSSSSGGESETFQNTAVMSQSRSKMKN